MVDTFHKVADLTADLVVFALEGESVKVLLVKRPDDCTAYPGFWAIPGGFLDEGERLIECAERELLEETGIELNEKNLLYPGVVYIGVFDYIGRDPRKRVISNVYAALIDKIEHPVFNNEIKEAKWFNVQSLPENIAFDHVDIIREAYMKAVLQSSSSDRK